MYRSCAVHEYHATFSARNACSACSNTAVYGPVIGYETMRRGRFLRSFQHCSATLKIKPLPHPATPIPYAYACCMGPKDQRCNPVWSMCSFAERSSVAARVGGLSLRLPHILSQGLGCLEGEIIIHPSDALMLCHKLSGQSPRRFGDHLHACGVVRLGGARIGNWKPKAAATRRIRGSWCIVVRRIGCPPFLIYCLKTRLENAVRLAATVTHNCAN
jgi:hypothetical protein